jgi:hypothetical protein
MADPVVFDSLVQALKAGYRVYGHNKHGFVMRRMSNCGWDSAIALISNGTNVTVNALVQGR